MKTVTVIYEFEDNKQFGANTVKARTLEAACQKAFRESAADNKWKLKRGETFLDNHHDWRLIMAFEGDMPTEDHKQLWGDTLRDEGQ